MTLMDFYRDYLAWIDAGALNDSPHGFSRGIGLCGNIWFWTWDNNMTAASIDLMSESFKNAGLDSKYPFESIWEHSQGIRKGTLYLNHKRIAWVRNQVRHGERAQKLFAVVS